MPESSFICLPLFLGESLILPFMVGTGRRSYPVVQWDLFGFIYSTFLPIGMTDSD